MSCTYEFQNKVYSRSEILSEIEKGIISPSYISEQKARKIVRDLLGMDDTQIEFINGLIDEKAIGRLLNDGNILLSNLATESTVYHEAFHRVFRGAISRADRLSLIKDIKSRKNWRNLVEPYREAYGDNEDLLIEEYLADEFGNYMLNNEDYKAPTLMQRIFRSLLNFLKNLGILRKTPIEDLYRNIREGKFAKSEFAKEYTQADSILINGIKFSQAEFAAIVENVHLVQMRALIDSGKLDAFFANKGPKISSTGVANVILNNIQSSHDPNSRVYKVIELYKNVRAKKLDSAKFKTFFEGLSDEDKLNVKKYISVAKDLLDKPYNESEIIKGYRTMAAALGSKFTEIASDNNEDNEPIEDDDTRVIIDPTDGFDIGGSNNSGLDKSSFETDPNSGISQKLKVLLSSVVNTNEKVPLGMKRTYDWVYFASFLNNHLAGLPATEEAIFGKLVELKSNPYYGNGVAQLIDLMGGEQNNSLDLTKVDMRIKFISKFAMTKQDFYLTILNNDNIYDINSNSNTVEDKLRKELNSKMNYTIAQEGGATEWLKKIQSNFNKYETKGIKNREEILKELTYLIGADALIEVVRENPDALSKEYAEVVIGIAEQINKHGSEIQEIQNNAYLKNRGERNEFGISKYTKRIIEMIKESGQVVELSTFNAEGKKVYIVSLPTYQSQVADGINYAKEKKKDIFQEFPQFNTIQGRASWFLRQINNYGNKITLGLNDGIKQETSGRKQHISEVSEQTLMADFINMLMNRTNRKPIYQAVKHSDRGNLFTYKIEGLDLLVQSVNQTKQETLDIFERYLDMEVQKLKVIRDGVGKDIQYYNRLTPETSLFGKMLDSNGITKTIISNELFEKLINDYDKYKSEGLEAIWKAIEEQALTDKKFAQSWGLLEEVQDKEKKYSKPVGIGLEVWNSWRNDMKQNGMNVDNQNVTDKILQLYTINSMIGYIEGGLMFTGDLNLYKSATDAFKRFSVWSSTGNLAVTGNLTSDFIKRTEGEYLINIDGTPFNYSETKYGNNPDFVSSITFAEEDYPVDEEFRTKMKDKSYSTLLEVFTNIGLPNAEELAKLHSDRLEEAYSKVNEPDGATWVNMFQWRRTKIQWGQWSEEHEELFKKELAILNGKDEFIIPEGVSAKIYLNDFLGLAETMKAQIAGPYWNDTARTSEINQQGVAKSGFYPLLPSQIRGTMLEKKHKYMLKNGIGMSHVNSARKVGQRVVLDSNMNPSNEGNFEKGLPTLYTKEGKLNLDIPLDQLVQYVGAEYVKHQTVIHNYDKEEILNSTQSYKLTISNLFNNGTPIDYKGSIPFTSLTDDEKLASSELYSLVKQYVDNVSKRIESSIVELEKEMGYGENGYESIASMVKVLKAAVSARGATSNVLEALDLFETATNKIIDLLPNKNRIEPVMYSLIRNNVLNQKRTGNSVPQVPSTLWDSIDSTRRVNDTGKVYSSTDLQYHVDEGYADIYLPIPMNWVDGLMNAYGTRDLIRLVDMVNNDIANKNYSKFDEDILFIKGLRIPNQQLASNDIFKVKKFLVPTNVAMVVVPSIITTKVGSDFDIDKLNMYMSNVKYTDGRLTRNPEDNDNQLLDIERKIMLNPLNYTNLMKPTDDRQWKGMGKDEGKGILKSKGLLAPEMSFWNVVTSTTNIEKTVENISSKGGVGIVAVHITGHANGQLYNLEVNLDGYSIPFVTDGSLGKIINENGEFISDLLSGLLTSQVDAVKDPYAKSLGLVNQTLNIAAYMLKRGVSHVKIIEFFAEPIIRDYIKTQQIWESPLYSESGLAFQMRNQLKLEKTNQVADALVRKKYGQVQQEKLDLFQTLVGHGKIHSTMIKSMSPDTFKPKSLSDTKAMKNAIEIMNSMADPETPPFIVNFASRNENAIVPVLEAHDKVTDEYGKLYNQFYMENQKFIEGKLDMISMGIAEVSYGENSIKHMKRLYEDFVNYLVQNYTETFKKYSYASVMLGDNSVPKQIIGLRNKSDEFRLFEMLVPITRNSDFGTDRLDNARMVDINDNPFNLESYINEIKELAENDPEFIDRLIAFTIYQSGMSNSVYTIDKILPAEYKHKLMQEAVNNVKDIYLDITDFANKFQLANPQILKRSSKKNKENAGLFQFLKTGQKIGKDYRTIIEHIDGTKYYPLGSSSFRIYNTEPIPFKGNTIVQKPSDNDWIVFTPKDTEFDNPNINFDSTTTVDKSLSWGELKDLPVYSNKGVMVMRKQGTIEHFGNPFTGSGVQGLIQMPNVASAVQAYKDWLNDTKYQDMNKEQRSWILSQIEQGNLDNKKLLYMKDKGNYYSHADALADIVNSRTKTNNLSTIFSSKNINPDDTLNIYWGSNENKNLSNLAPRQFMYNEKKYFSVEHAYQSLKSGKFDLSTYNKYKSAGIKISGLPAKTEGNYNINLMKTLIKTSFEQNPQAMQELIGTGNKTLTHNQDKGIWREIFPKLLMEVRDEFVNCK